MFLTALDIKALPDPNMWSVDAPLIWFDERHGKITVPAGEMTDLASIPRLFQNILNVNGYARRPAVLHDFLYRYSRTDAGKVLTRSECDGIFLTALEIEGSGAVERHALWIGVRMGGWAPYGNYRKLGR